MLGWLTSAFFCERAFGIAFRLERAAMGLLAALVGGWHGGRCGEAAWPLDPDGHRSAMEADVIRPTIYGSSGRWLAAGVGYGC